MAIPFGARRMANSLAVWRPSLWTSHTPPRSGAAMTAFEEDMSTTDRAFGKVASAASIFLQTAWVRKAPRAFTAKFRS